MKKLSLFSIFILFLSLHIVSAQCYINNKQVPCDQFWESFRLLFIGFWVVFIVAFVFWLLMLIDCLQRDFKDKTVWIIVLILTTFIGAVLYYFLVKRKNPKS